jgi:hypothetical protein
MGQSVIKIGGADSLSGADAIYFDTPDKRNKLLTQVKVALAAWRSRYRDVAQPH